MKLYDLPRKGKLQPSAAGRRISRLAAGAPDPRGRCGQRFTAAFQAARHAGTPFLDLHQKVSAHRSAFNGFGGKNRNGLGDAFFIGCHGTFGREKMGDLELFSRAAPSSFSKTDWMREGIEKSSQDSFASPDSKADRSRIG